MILARHLGRSILGCKLAQADAALEEAAVEAAKLDLGYTVITAPISGSVVDKHVEVGDRVQQGQPVMTLVPPPSDLYVTANFKETQLNDVRVGQKAEIRPDIYPGTVFHAHVDSLSMGTGAAFALLPPENATGNWVKVVQRLPVKLVLDQPPPPDKPLRMGLSVEAVVDVSDTRGPVLASLMQESRRIVPAKNSPDTRGTASAAACALRVDSIQVCGATPSFASDDRRAGP